MGEPPEFLAGIVEGFYGRQWSFGTRLSYARYLADAGLNACLYCPKGDLYLRKAWQEDWPDHEWRSLRAISREYQARKIFWGVGLSPVELYRNYGNPQRRILRAKIERLLELEGSLLAILFDDMPGDLDALASRQSEIVSDVCDWVGNVRVIVCPTYYSYDPLLERHFGAMPDGYWSRLGRELPPAVDIFWTGNRVCSDSIARQDVDTIVHELGRPVTLWDNYPVNDSATRCKFLYLSKLSRRSPELRASINGHFCNPMNQGVLSLFALSGLAELYGGTLDEASLERLIGAETWERLSRDRADFELLGLDGLDKERRMSLANEYAALPDAAAQEVAEWLLGDYGFDPACLTA